MLSPILAVSDIDASVDFYVKALGFSHGWSMNGDDGRTNFASIRLGDAEILLGVTEGFVPAEDLNKRGIGVQLHVHVPPEMDIDALYASAQAVGAQIMRTIETRDWGERAFNLKDPDGYSLMLAQQVTPP